MCLNLKSTFVSDEQLELLWVHKTHRTLLCMIISVHLKIELNHRKTINTAVTTSALFAEGRGISSLQLVDLHDQRFQNIPY